MIGVQRLLRLCLIEAAAREDDIPHRAAPSPDRQQLVGTGGLGGNNTDGAAAGCLRFARNEIPRLDDDRNYPDRGALALTLTGGK